jgi:pectin methylesterase-like acyl-CoA thioesterase
MKKIQVVAVVAMVASPVMAADLLVPGTYATIQSAIDAAVSGDVIVVNPGAYPGGLYVAGKSLSIRSASPSQTVVISGQGGRGVEVVNVPSPGLVLRGLEFTGCAGGPLGGAILATSSWLDFESCAFGRIASTEVAAPSEAQRSTPATRSYAWRELRS